VQVAQIDGNKWAVTVRGFNSRWANKLLVMIDGRSIYSDVFAGVYWDALDLPVDLIERIEVIRGPGGSLWGANAVNGVINIITTTPSSRQGAVSASVGELGLATTTLRYAAPVGQRVRYQTYFSATDHGALYPGLTSDRWRSLQFGASGVFEVSARDTVDIRAAVLRSNAWGLSPTLVSSVPLLNRIGADETETTGYHGSAHWTRLLAGGGSVVAAGSWAMSRRYDHTLEADSGVLDLSFQHSASRTGRHELTWGAALRRADYVLTGSPTLGLAPGLPQRQSQAGAFLQDEINLASDRVVVTLGTKFERFARTGWHLQPSARARWVASPRQTVWAAASRAIRTPSLTEQGMVVNLFQADGRVPLIAQMHGNPDLRPELLKAYEAGYRWAARALTLDVAAFYNRYDDVVNLEIGTPYFVTGPGLPHLILPIVFDNQLKVSTAGGEALVTIAPNARWRMIGSYGLFTVGSRLEAGSRNFSDGAFDASAPRHQGTLRSSLALPRSIDVDTTLFLMGALDTKAVPSYARLDTRVAWRVLPTLDLSVLGRNVLDSRHLEFAGDGSVVFGPTRRQVSATATWRF
jgi:iron complex outermembrane receptor protein